MEAGKQLRIEIMLGEFRDVLEIDAGILAEGRTAELEAKLRLIPLAVDLLARKVGYRLTEDAQMDAVAAFNAALEVGDAAEADRLMAVMESLAKR